MSGATPSPGPAGASPDGPGDGSAECGPACQEALEDLERFLDGELAEDQVGRISAHLAACYPCTDRATFEEQLRAIVRRGCADAAPPDLIQRIRVRLDDAVPAGPADGVGG